MQPGTDGLQSTFGVFADSKSNTLFTCSNAFGGAPGAAAAPATLYAFDLKTGAPKGHYPFVTKGALCNDIATTADGLTFATDTSNMQVEVLKKGGTALEVWAGADGGLGKKGGAVDGISILGHRAIVNELSASKLFSVEINKDGTAGTPVEVTLDRPISRPDGMRSFGKSAVLIIEGGDGGKLEKGHLRRQQWQGRTDQAGLSGWPGRRCARGHHGLCLRKPVCSDAGSSRRSTGRCEAFHGDGGRGGQALISRWLPRGHSPRGNCFRTPAAALRQIPRWRR